MTALPAVGPLLQRMSEELKAYLAHRQITDPAFVGIHTGGVWIAVPILVKRHAVVHVIRTHRMKVFGQRLDRLDGLL